MPSGRVGGAPARVARWPLVGAALAEDRGLDPQLEQPVRVVGLEEPASRDALPQLARRDEPRPAPDGELVGRVLVLVGVEGVPPVLGQVVALHGVEQEHVQPVVHDAHGDRVDPGCGVRATHGREQRGPVGAIEVPGAGGREVRCGGGELAPGGGGVDGRRHGGSLADEGSLDKVRFMRIREVRIALTVDDYDAAVAFYRDALGLAEVEAWDRPNGRGTILDAGRATLELFDALPAETLDRIEVGRQVSGAVRFALHVDAAAAAARELVAAGADLEHDVVETPWGDLNARVRAPDGMQLTLFTSPEGGPRPWDGESG